MPASRRFCVRLSRLGETAVDVDWAGLCRWEERSSGVAVEDPPYPVPAGWLDRYGWKLVRDRPERLAASNPTRPIFLCGSAENEADVRDLFDRVVCLVVDDTVDARPSPGTDLERLWRSP